MKILEYFFFCLAFFPFVLILVSYLFLHFCIYYKKTTTNKHKTLEQTVQNDTGSNLWISRLH